MGAILLDRAGWRGGLSLRMLLGIAGMAVTVLIGAASGVVYERHHVSASLRATLRSASAPDLPEARLPWLLEQASYDLHTWRDREEYGKLQRAVADLAAARVSEARMRARLRQSQAELNAEIHSERLMLITEGAYLDSRFPMPAGLAEDVAREQQRRERARDERRREEDNRWLQILEQRLDGRVLLRQIRQDLGGA